MSIAITAGYDADYQIYQRNRESKKILSPAEISLDLAVLSLPKGLEIQCQIEPFGGGAAIKEWHTVGSTTGVTPVVVSIDDIPQGPWYQWLFRTTHSNGTVIETMTSLFRFGVGDVYGMAGQSNGANFFTVLAAPPAVNSKTAVNQSAVWGLPSTNGPIVFLDQMQVALADGGEDIVVGLVNICQGGSATLPKADYLPAGAWSDPAYGLYIFDIFQRTFVRALRYNKWVQNNAINQVSPCAGILYWQGEAEATVPASVFNISVMSGEFITGLLELFGNFAKWMPTQTEKGVIQIQIGRMDVDSVTEISNGLISTVGMTREVHYQIANDYPESRSALCSTIEVPKSSDGIHYIASEFETAAMNLGLACRKAFGIAPNKTVAGYTRLPANNGPTISGLRWTSRTKLLVTVKHDAGSDITIPVNAHELFSLVNNYGKAYFSAIVKVSSNSFELTLGSSINGPEVGFNYCSDSMPNIGSLIYDDEGYYLHQTISTQSSRAYALPDLPENLIGGKDSICLAGTNNTVTLAPGDGADVSPGDMIYVSDQALVVSKGYRRVSDVTGDIVTVSRDFDVPAAANDVARYSSQVVIPNDNMGRLASGSVAINNPDGISSGIRGRRI